MLFSKIFCGNFVEIENFSNLELDLKATVITTKIETILKKQPSTFKVQTDPNWQIQKSHTRARISCSWNKDECSINSNLVIHLKDNSFKASQQTIMLRRNGLKSHFDNSTLIILCFVFLHFNASMPGSQSWRSSVAISAVRAIIPFFEANKNQYNESIHLILGCSKNYHEIEEGSKPRWVSWGGKNQY